MEFIRSDSGLEARDLFYSKVLVYVEGYSDIPFYEEVLQGYNYHLKALSGNNECEKLITSLVDKNHPYVVILDGHYEALEPIQSQHSRVVLLDRHSYENYLIEEEPIKQFCRDRARSKDSVDEPLSSNKFQRVLKDTKIKFKDLLVLDVAHQRSNTGQKTFFQNPDRFFKIDFRDNEIQKQCAAAAKNINIESLNEAKILVEEFLKERRCIDLLPGHFAFGIIRRLISNIIGKSISNDEIRLYLSRIIWRLVKSRDHNSLKKRLLRAVQEVERIRDSNSN